MLIYHDQKDDRYIVVDGRKILGNSTGENDLWFTLSVSKRGGDRHRLSSPALPAMATRQEAEDDLRKYAAKKKWTCIEDSNGQGSIEDFLSDVACAAHLDCPDPAPGHVMKVMDLGSPDTPTFDLRPGEEYVPAFDNTPAMIVTYGCTSPKKRPKKDKCPVVPDHICCAGCKLWLPVGSREVGELPVMVASIQDGEGPAIPMTPAPEAVPLPISKDSLLTDRDKEDIAAGRAVLVDLPDWAATAISDPPVHACTIEGRCPDGLLSSEYRPDLCDCCEHYKLVDPASARADEIAPALREENTPAPVQEVEEVSAPIGELWSPVASIDDGPAPGPKQISEETCKGCGHYDPSLSGTGKGLCLCKGECPRVSSVQETDHYEEFCNGIAARIHPEESLNYIDKNNSPDPKPGFALVDINLLSPNPQNPRKNFDDNTMVELAENIRQHGIILPLVCVKENDPSLVPYGLRIVAGERRYRAAQIIGLKEVPVIIRDIAELEEMELMLSENIQRSDLNPLEEAQAYNILAARGYTQTAIAERLGISQPQVANRLRLLRLSDKVKESITSQKISAYHGLALLKLEKQPDLAAEVMQHIINHGVTVADTEAKIDQFIRQRGLHLFKQGYGEEPAFNPDRDCEKNCPFRLLAVSEYGDKKKHPWCLDKKCWHKLQDQAHEAAAKKLIDTLPPTKQAGDPVDPDKLKYGTYEKFKDYRDKFIIDPADCSAAGCEFLQVAKEKGYICMKPSCFKDKKKKSERQATKELKQKTKSFEEIKDQLIQDAGEKVCHWMYGAVATGLKKEVLACMAAGAIYDGPASSNWTDDKKRKALYEMFGWEEPASAGWVDHQQDMIKRVATLTEPELWKVLCFGLLRSLSEDHDLYRFTIGADVGKDEGVIGEGVAR